MSTLSSKLGFVIFYFTFISFVVYVSGQAGAQILKNVPEFAGVPQPNVVDIMTTIQWFFALLTISTDYQILFTLVFAPLTVGLFWTIIELARGV